MKGHIPQDIIDRVISASNIVDIISTEVLLKKNGHSYKGLCPFHSEKTPSFVVNQEKGLFHCFGCGAGGNVIGFMKKIDPNLSFVEAVRLLASRYNIHIPKSDDNSYRSPNEDILSVNQKASAYFSNTLKGASGSEGIAYLKKRGITADIIKSFSLGYAAPSWNSMANYLNKREGISLELLHKAGLIKKREDEKGYYDVFRNRIIFPIHDTQNRVIGFGGRLIDSSDKNTPKYINTGETDVYTKGNNLFGLNLSKDFIKSEKKVVIVEGYLDLITAYQYGIKNVVATLGTALTLEQVQLLKRYTTDVIILFDGDIAGEAATERSYINLTIKGGMKTKVVSLPDKHDPDSFIRNSGKDSFIQYIDNAVSFINYIIDKYSDKIKKESTMEDKITHLNKIISLIAENPNAVERSSYVSTIAEKTGISDKALIKETENAILNAKRSIVIENKNTKNIINPIDKHNNNAEYLLLQLLLLNRDKIDGIKNKICPEDIDDKILSNILCLLFSFADKKKGFSIASIIEHIGDDTEMSRTISQIAIEEIKFDDIDKGIDDCIKNIKSKSLVKRKDQLFNMRKEMVKNGTTDREEFERLQKEYNDIKKGIRVTQSFSKPIAN